MMPRFADTADRTVIVTGGASGIGGVLVDSFVAQGARTGFIDILAEAGQARAQALAAGGATVAFAAADLCDLEALAAAMAQLRERLGPVDVLVNCAALDERHATSDLSGALFDRLIAVNLRHVIFASQQVLPEMVARGSGSIINFSSISWMTSTGGMICYTAAKAGILGVTRSLARDYGAHGIRVNTVSPGWVRTPRQLSKWITPQAERETMAQQCLKRWLTPEDIAPMVLFLASDASAGCTAQNFVVDAGWT